MGIHRKVLTLIELYKDFKTLTNAQQEEIKRAAPKEIKEVFELIDKNFIA